MPSRAHPAVCRTSAEALLKGLTASRSPAERDPDALGRNLEVTLLVEAVLVPLA